MTVHKLQDLSDAAGMRNLLQQQGVLIKALRHTALRAGSPISMVASMVRQGGMLSTPEALNNNLIIRV